MDTVIQVIKELGFPIACVVALFWQNNKMADQHKQETEALTAALNNNTTALARIEAKLGVETDGN